MLRSEDAKNGTGACDMCVDGLAVAVDCGSGDDGVFLARPGHVSALFGMYSSQERWFITCG